MGNEKINKDELIQELKEQGLEIGTPKRKINKKTEVPVLGASVFLILDKIKKNATICYKLLHSHRYII